MYDECSTRKAGKIPRTVDLLDMLLKNLLIRINVPAEPPGHPPLLSYHDIFFLGVDLLYFARLLNRS